MKIEEEKIKKEEQKEECNKNENKDDDLGQKLELKK